MELAIEIIKLTTSVVALVAQVALALHAMAQGKKEGRK